MIKAGEVAILECLDRHFPNSHHALELGRGDDCAFFRPTSGFCVSSDLFLEDVHFRTRYFSPAQIGAKALTVNLSDIAACGAKPVAFSLCLGLPSWVEKPWLENFFEGMSSVAAKAGAVLCGGDLSASDKLHISITVFGERLPGCDFLSRAGARPGWRLFVVGSVGLGRVGLAVLESLPLKEALASWPKACAAHLAPMPKTGLGMTIARLAQTGGEVALMDVSDGLARDLPRLLESSGCAGAKIMIPQARLEPEVSAWAIAHGQKPLMEAWLGGEDYALLGACAPSFWPRLQELSPELWPLGTVTSQPGIFCGDKLCESQVGFDHFMNLEKDGDWQEVCKTQTEA